VKLVANPLVHEIFTWVWLHDLAERAGRAVTLADVPDDVWDGVAGSGVDAVWLMGVWERSPAGAAIARTHPAMAAAQRSALPDVMDDDVVGSAYCIRNYHVDGRLGGEAGLATARDELASRGVGLVLDFVPNHVAPDHPWVEAHPDYFVREGDGTIALGRDPYFPPWPEVLQLDASLVAVRRAAAEVVSSIADRCDAIRCDMAMLVLDDVFARTWGDRALGGASPDGGRGYWPTVIGAVRATYPDVAFWAEAYWDLEPVLVEQGFDACYDKRLYDRLVHREPVGAIRDHLKADAGYQVHTIRFVENHDEPRLAAVMEPPLDRAAAVVALTLPGVALLHEGQADGRRVRVPVTLGRRPDESAGADLAEWYGQLLAAIGAGMRRGEWALVEVDGWPDNRTCDQLVAWTWSSPLSSHLVVVNLSDGRADGLVRLPTVSSGPLAMVDGLSGERYERDGDTIRRDGLYVALPPGGTHLLRW
jgi:hypothetical protein